MEWVLTKNENGVFIPFGFFGWDKFAVYDAMKKYGGFVMVRKDMGVMELPRRN